MTISLSEYIKTRVIQTGKQKLYRITDAKANDVFCRFGRWRGEVTINGSQLDTLRNQAGGIHDSTVPVEDH
jgi:hypothetical protein